MSSKKKFQAGEIGWIDLTVPEANLISDFYQQVVGWKVAQLYTEHVYNMLSTATDNQVAIIVQKEETQIGPPSYWLPYIIVSNLDESIATCERLGGKVIKNLHDDDESSNYCVIQDPAGAYIALTTLADYRLPMNKQPGEIVGIDLTISQAKQVRDFYQQLVGWQAEELDMGDYADYMLKPAGTEMPVTGICHRQGENANLPAYWLIYVGVADLATSMTTCKQLGGKVVDGPRSGYCVIQDPAGAYIALMQIDQ